MQRTRIRVWILIAGVAAAGAVAGALAASRRARPDEERERFFDSLERSGIEVLRPEEAEAQRREAASRPKPPDPPPPLEPAPGSERAAIDAWVASKLASPMRSVTDPGSLESCREVGRTVTPDDAARPRRLSVRLGYECDLRSYDTGSVTDTKRRTADAYAHWSERSGTWTVSD